MRIYDNGTYRDMTPQEIAEWEKSQEQPEPVPDELERIEAQLIYTAMMTDTLLPEEE